jgi:SNF2 family DNA or RNA helicase
MEKDISKPDALNVLNNLRKICNHPYLFFAYHQSPKASTSGFKFN